MFLCFLVCLDVVVQPKTIGGPISNGATVQSTSHLNGTTPQNGLLEHKLSSLSVEGIVHNWVICVQKFIIKEGREVSISCIIAYTHYVHML